MTTITPNRPAQQYDHISVEQVSANLGASIRGVRIGADLDSAPGPAGLVRLAARGPLQPLRLRP